MSDLVALSPNSNFPLYIVTPDVRLDKVRCELSDGDYRRSPHTMSGKYKIACFVIGCGAW